MSSISNTIFGLPLLDRSMELLRSRPVIRRRTLKRRLRAVLDATGMPVGAIVVERGPDQQPPWLTRVRVRGNRVVLIVAPGIEQSRVYWYLFDRLPAVVYFALLAGESLAFEVDLSDGHMGYRDVLGFCGNHHSVVLIPDPDFFNSRGYAAERQQPAPDWLARRSEIIWRGSPNGQGLISNSTMKADDPDLIQRVRMCLLLRDQEGIDARLVFSDRTADLSPGDSIKLERAGIAGQPIDRAEWWQRRFAIDIDGYTNAWSGLFTRLLMGCCVLKVASPTGHRQWYYHRLEPWKHYIPVAADLSDLRQKIDWCRAHEVECAQIARQGRELAISMDFDAEYRLAVAALALRPEFRLPK